MSASVARRGITLMEVLIAIGILAVGLTSVVSLVPAGQSQAARAVILDRAAATLANGLQDAATYGMLRPDSIATDPVGGGPVIVFDPVRQHFGGLAALDFPNAVRAWVKPSGVYSQASSPNAYPAGIQAWQGNESWQVMQLAAQSRDDILVSPGAGPDDPPVNTFDANGVRFFNGRMTCIFSVARADNQLTTALAAGDVAKLTVIAFHNRDTTDTGTRWVEATFDGAKLTITGSIPAGRTLKEIVRPGVVIYDPNKTDASNANDKAQYLRWSQVQMGSVDSTDGSVYVTFSSPTPTVNADGNGNLLAGFQRLRILLDSVGMAEQMVVLEGSGPYSK
jgi:hypothetical protein